MKSMVHRLAPVLICILWFGFGRLAGQTSFNISNKTSGDTLLSIDNNGRVGLGTTEPAAALDIVSAAEETASAMYLRNSNDTHWLYLYGGRGGGSPLNPAFMWQEGDALRFTTFGTQFTEMMRISDAGDLGLGIADPGAKMDIQLAGTGAWQRGLRILNPDMVTDDGLLLVLGRTDESRNMGYMNYKYSGDDSESNRISFGLYGVNDVLNILGSGNVGIGTIAPSDMLEVAGIVHSNAGGFRFPDGSVQTTAAGTGGATAINELSDAATDAGSVFLGSGAGSNDDGDNFNTAVGVDAMASNSTGLENTAVGTDALNSNTIGSANSAIGYQTLYSNIDGRYNTAIGREALYSNIGARFNTANGYMALYHNTSGYFNVGLGSAANYYNQTGQQNTIIGCQAGYGVDSDSKSGSVFLGYQAGYSETEDDKLYIENSNSSAPLIWGDFSTDSLRIHGDLHVTGNIHGDGLGIVSSINDLSDGKTGGLSVFLGSGAGYTDDGSDNQNTGVGTNALYYNSSGSQNAAYGWEALINNTTGSSNIAVGPTALLSNTTGGLNIAIGPETLHDNTSGDNNIAIGPFALYANTTAQGNLAIGNSALRYHTSGMGNTAVGTVSLYSNTNGVSNVGIGPGANYYNQEGDRNTIIGNQAGYGPDVHNKSGSVFLGNRAGYNETESDKLYIENSDSDTPLIGGDFANDEIYLYGSVGIGTDSPNYPLTILPGDNNRGISIDHDQTSGGATYSIHVDLDNTNSGDLQTYGISSTATSTAGASLTSGLYGRADGDATGDKFGTYGYATGNGDNIYGVYGKAYNTSGNSTHFGLYGIADGTDDGFHYGAYGYADGNGINYGGYFESTDWGVYGRGTTGVRGIGYGDYGVGVSAMGMDYDFYATGPGTDYGSESSIRWKRNIMNIDNPLEKVADLRGVYFDWDEEHGGQHDVGCIAEEVGAVIPEIVEYEENGVDAKGMDYSKLTPLLLEAIKAQQENINKQQEELEDLKARIKSLETLLVSGK